MNNNSFKGRALLKTSVYKLNLVLKSIRGRSLESALHVLASVDKPIVTEVRKVLLSVVSNAQNSSVDGDMSSAYIRIATAGRAFSLRRFHPRGRGKISPVKKHYSRLFLELTVS